MSASVFALGITHIAADGYLNISGGLSSPALSTDAAGGSGPLSSNTTYGIGLGSLAYGFWGSVAVGDIAQSYALQGTALGVNARIDPGIGTITSIGPSSNAVALGSNSTIRSSVSGIGVGYLSSVTGSAQGVAIGESALVNNATGGVAIGRSATVNGFANSIALGAGSTATAANVLSVGSPTLQRRITNVAPGTLVAAGTDAVNGGQLFTTNNNLTTTNTNLAATNTSLANTNTSLATTNANLATTNNNVTTVTNSAATNAAGLVTTNSNLATTNNNVTAVTNTAATTNTALGVTNTNLANTNTSLATTNTNLAATNNNVTAVTATAAANTAGLATTNTNLATTNTNLANTNTSLATTNTNLAAVTTSAAANTAGLATTNTNLATTNTNLADTNTSLATTNNNLATTNNNVTAVTDATTTNTADLVTANTNLATANTRAALAGNNLAAALGGGATFDAVTGGISAPSYVLNSSAGGTFNNVGSALGALDTGIINNTSSIAALNAGTGGLVQQAAPTSDITVGANSGGANVSLAGSTPATATRKLTNVTAGDIASATSTDAVNGGQLFTTNTNLATTNTNLATTNTNLAAVTTSAATNAAGLVTTNTNLADTNNNLATTNTNLATTDSNVTNVTAGLATTNTNLNTANTRAAAANTVIANAFGGGATFDAATGGISAPSYVLNSSAGGTFNNVGSALTALDTGIISNTSSIAALNAGTGGLVQQDPVSQNISVGSASGGDQVSVAGSGGTRKLVGVTGGNVAGGSTEAINGGQLFSANSSIAAALGGGSILNPDGTLTSPSYSLSSTGNTTPYSNVGSALIALDAGISGGTVGLVQQSTSTSPVTVAASSAGNEVNFSGTAGTRTLTGVSNGAVNATSTEAVNGGQLYIVNQQVTQNTGDISTLQSNITGVMTGTSGIVTQAAATDKVLVASKTGGTTVDVSGTDGTRVISGVSDGIADSDAATIRQIRALQVALPTAPSSSGSSIVVNGTGSTTASGANSAAFGSNASATGSNALAIGNDSSASGSDSSAIGRSATASGESSTALGVNSRATATNSVALGANSVASEANTVSVGSIGNERRITNVAPGINDTDAVNVGQLNKGLSDIQTSNNRSFRQLDKRIDNLEDKLTAGVASSMAMAGIPQAYQPDSSLVGASISGYQNQQAIAVGVSAISPNGLWITKLQGSGNTQSDFGMSVGIGYQW
ncbi:YadA family autotransporter adhesin [Rouxiella sp. T17]|uniref:YadA family autotransporter adhesin n=1 Tax=Rouxiella sp. T17 TaxID=3085684 RepID=UPI002FCC7E03